MLLSGLGFLFLGRPATTGALGASFLAVSSALRLAFFLGRWRASSSALRRGRGLAVLALALFAVALLAAFLFLALALFGLARSSASRRRESARARSRASFSSAVSVRSTTPERACVASAAARGLSVAATFGCTWNGGFASQRAGRSSSRPAGPSGRFSWFQLQTSLGPSCGSSAGPCSAPIAGRLRVSVPAAGARPPSGIAVLIIVVSVMLSLQSRRPQPGSYVSIRRTAARNFSASPPEPRQHVPHLTGQTPNPIHRR